MYIEKTILLLGFLLFPLPGFADSEGIPWSFVFFQVFNFSIFLFGLCYLLIKKLPPILRQKREDFLDYRKRAVFLEKRNRVESMKLEKEFLVLEEKAKNIQVTAQQAIDDLRRGKQREYEFWLDNTKKQHEQEWLRQKRKKITSMKSWILSQVLQETGKKLQSWSKSPKSHEVAEHIIHKKWSVQ